LATHQFLQSKDSLRRKGYAVSGYNHKS
jgi:hypothetical protein